MLGNKQHIRRSMEDSHIQELLSHIQGNNHRISISLLELQLIP
jgi:hypothetical protein